MYTNYKKNGMSYLKPLTTYYFLQAWIIHITGSFNFPSTVNCVSEPLDISYASQHNP